MSKTSLNITINCREREYPEELKRKELLRKLHKSSR